ncbi:MAG: glycosyltransferase family A protein [Terriglobia bacterium]|jgi:glycosyltransferase involved in cell wall biosynthesis
MKYVIITPVRDEEQHIEDTLRSVLAQTILPAEWVIVDDGSTDGTGRILERYARQHAWISVIHRPDRGFRNSGGGVMEAFDEGYRALRSRDWDLIVKLDGDLSFGPDYFERCLRRFAEDPGLGIGGGVIYYCENGTKRLETSHLFHVRGATKMYRHACWDAIGGLIRTPGWDTVDELKANMLGWRTRCFPDVLLLQHRPTGAADGNWRDAVKNGQADYVSGYHPLFMLAKCLKRAFQRPLLVGAVGHLYGFAQGYIQRLPKVEDQKFIRYVRRQQLRRLFFQESIWK